MYCLGYGGIAGYAACGVRRIGIIGYIVGIAGYCWYCWYCWYRWYCWGFEFSLGSEVIGQMFRVNAKEIITHLYSVNGENMTTLNSTQQYPTIPTIPTIPSNTQQYPTIPTIPIRKLYEA